MPGLSTEERNELENTICQEILCFLARHPFTKFNRMALIGNFDSYENRHVDRALKKLVVQELVAFQSCGNVYWLTPQEPAHSLLCSKFGTRGNAPTNNRPFLLGKKGNVVLV